MKTPSQLNIEGVNVWPKAGQFMPTTVYFNLWNLWPTTWDGAAYLLTKERLIDVCLLPAINNKSAFSVFLVKCSITLLVHGRNVFGQSASYRCSTSGSPHDSGCRGRLFCLPDPYGCSCAAGYTGLDCTQGKRQFIRVYLMNSHSTSHHPVKPHNCLCQKRWLFEAVKLDKFLTSICLV